VSLTPRRGLIASFTPEPEKVQPVGVLVVAHYQSQLAALGLTSLSGVKNFQGDLVKNHRGRRDIFRVTIADDDGVQRLLFLKRNWRPYKKDGLASLLRRGTVWSLSRQEWENSRALEAAGLRTARLVAHGEECSWLSEKFSFIITEAAQGRETLQEFLCRCHDSVERRRVFDALAREIRRMHDAGLAAPDLFTHHIFVDTTAEPPRFCLIDMARLDRRNPAPDRLRARDLAVLNLTAPVSLVTAKERLRFLRLYVGGTTRAIAGRIARRVQHLLGRRKFGKFLAQPAES
jgi:tRNA A-37 threonylcarbamoyl transferase component Bud32